MINVNLLYPVGSIYISINSTNPSNIFGGTWERIKGKMLIGVDENDNDFKQSGLTGGEKNHILTVDEIPPHQHIVNGYKGANAWATGSIWFRAADSSTGNTTASGQTTSTGGGQAHNNMPPYYSVYIFVRTA